MKNIRLTMLFLMLIASLVVDAQNLEAQSKDIDDQVVFIDFVGVRHYSSQFSNIAAMFENKSGKTITAFKGVFYIYNEFAERIGQERFEINSNFRLCTITTDNFYVEKLLIPDASKFLIDIGDRACPSHYFVIEEGSIESALEGWYFPVTDEITFGIIQCEITAIVFSDGTILKK